MLSGKTALITGASGIAAATALRFAAEGAAVAVVDRDPSCLEALKQDLAGVLAFERDLTDSAACSSLLAEVVRRLGHIDILFNVVGISGRSYGDGPVHLATDESFDTLMRVNVKTTLVMCREALAHMLPRRTGSIINTASVLAYAPSAQFFETHVYAASKGAIIALSRAMASSYAPQGVRVNVLAPGLIATPMSQRAQDNPEILAYIRAKQPLTGLLGSADDVADVALFLASDLSRFVTGELIEVAGGWSVAG